ncbi:hypothetical protein, unlikely [Trypanosoma brucei gambiense DAL972]|uniref:Uncharacterized protein n=1 Tax=Trypanosoma brucei gambiense (strain MHOM/CI/86/DAL972) TaxID=679716 RepID=C9ZL86_TRYB9|nr:hypothetical protein, unlikely [Trypanosoma brucei gambiense DAL972]CBH10095.1 hypothetical protein, unlikely [Trypanosoma brucei gambiense DAL972]|eukprot:XP_011772385.1 hypothetical protein, unlikely [Trypanosoma brucei gambiense DAL972]
MSVAHHLRMSGGRRKRPLPRPPPPPKKKKTRALQRFQNYRNIYIYIYSSRLSSVYLPARAAAALKVFQQRGTHPPPFKHNNAHTTNEPTPTTTTMRRKKKRKKKKEKRNTTVGFQGGKKC